MKHNDHFSDQHYKASKKASGPIHFLNPTTRYYLLQRRRTAPPSSSDEDKPEGPSQSAPQPQPEAWHVWRSRDNRKGRHTAAIGPDYKQHGRNKAPPSTNTLRSAWRGVRKMVTVFPVWDVSYNVAVIFTLGSFVWCLNGFLVWLPLVAPSTKFENNVLYGGGLTAFIGTTIFVTGAIFLMLEAVNENRADCFGWALEEAWESGPQRLRKQSGPRYCRHHHVQRGSFLRPGGGVAFCEEEKKTEKEEGGDLSGKDGASSEDSGGGGAGGDVEEGERRREKERRWFWLPSWYELRTHYFKEIGFLASMIQVMGSFIFYISGITALPMLQRSLSESQIKGVYWAPKVVGSTGFIIASALYMMETQTRWWKPNPKILGWYVGFCNLMGSFGFILSGIFGFFADQPRFEYAMSLSGLLGSLGFLTGSLVQWYETLNKYPISIEDEVPPEDDENM